MGLAESDKICVDIQKMVFGKKGKADRINSFEPDRKSEKDILPDGMVHLNDISYKSKYPNGFIDIWYPDEETNTKRPTVLYFHGGGCLFGDKLDGDPLAEGAPSECSVIKMLVRHGCNVVSANYALAPEYRFPVQLIQVNELAEFLVKEGENYAISMDDVIVMGSSAGANLTELYGAVLSNPEYAKKIGVRPALSVEQIRGLIVDESALDVRHMEGNLRIMGECWLGTDDLLHAEPASLAHVSDFITKDYPRTFINASNEEPCFKDSTSLLKEKLQGFGVEYTYFYVEQEESLLKHGYLNQFATNPHAKACMEGILKFLGI